MRIMFEKGHVIIRLSEDEREWHFDGQWDILQYC